VGLRRVLSEPKTWQRIHGSLAITWALLIVPSILWWRESLLWVIAMSCYANFAGSVASWTAARADHNSPAVEDLERIEGKVDALAHKVSLLVARVR